METLSGKTLEILLDQNFAEIEAQIQALANTPSGVLVQNQPSAIGATAILNNNPATRIDWSAINGAAAQNYDGLAVDVGGYGGRAFHTIGAGGVGTVSAISGAVNIPASSAIPAHCQGVGGYARTYSTSAGAVGVFGQSDSAVSGSYLVAGNFLAQDHGNSGTAVGIEIDMNIDNAATTCVGLDITGGATVEPTSSNGVRVRPIGIFTSPPTRWQVGLCVEEGSSVVGAKIDAAASSASSPSMPLQMFYRNSSGVPTQGMNMMVDGGGNLTLQTTTDGTIACLSSMFGGSPQYNFRATGNWCGFFGSIGGPKPTVSGSKGGNAALASLIAALASLGLITDSTT
jgi:hypothetical protein